MDMNSISTDFLFAKPSFVSGFARLLDWFGLFDSYNESRDGNVADARAIYADWRIVGQDIHAAAVEFNRAQSAKAKMPEQSEEQLALFAKG